MDITMNKWSLVGVFMLLCLLSAIESQSSIPAVHDGFWYGGKSAAEESVLIEAFFDPVCPDSRDSWPPLKQALAQYGSRVRLVVHTFALPYHDYAFATSRALHIANKLNSSATYHVLEAFFHHQQQFYNKATFDKSKSAVVDQIVSFTARALGTSFHSAIKSGFNDTKSDHATRVSFKVDAIAGHEVLSFLDLYKGYHQVLMDPADATKTAFITDFGVFAYLKMPFGLKNAGATYQRLVDKVFTKQMYPQIYMWLRY